MQLLPTAALAMILLGCAVSRHPYGETIVETTSSGSSCMGSSHSRLIGRAGRVLVPHLGAVQVSPDGRWMIAHPSCGKGNRLHVVDLQDGEIRSTHPLPGEALDDLGLLAWSQDGRLYLLPCRESPATVSLRAIRFAADGASIRTLYREEGKEASFRRLESGIWAPDGASIAFLVFSNHAQPGGADVALMRVGIGEPGEVREIDRPAFIPRAWKIEWRGNVPRLMEITDGR